MLRLARQALRHPPPPAGLSRRRYHAALLNDLAHRGLVQDITSPDSLDAALLSGPRVIYAGVDPTAKSLHIGHLLPLLTLLHFQLHGHQIIPLIGSATGRIGDPSGRLVERQLEDLRRVEDNVTSLTHNIHVFFTRALQYAERKLGNEHPPFTTPKVLSNIDWHQNLGIIDFLQTVGIHTRVSTMLNRESVRARMNTHQGLSFTEFTYQLLQAYDFYWLHKQHKCDIQLGGSDQWGNIVAGLELIGKLNPSPAGQAKDRLPAYGVTTPLLVSSTGEKFGKSAGNAVWLDPSMTSIFDFYQYFIKVADADVEKYLKIFTLLPLPDIQDIINDHLQHPEKRMAQRHLAAEVTELVHSTQGVKHAEILTSILFDSNYSTLKANDVIRAFENDPRLVMVNIDELFEVPLAKLASKHKLVSSNAAARALVTSRGLYLNNHPLTDAQFKLTSNDLIDGRIAVIRAGKDKLLVFATS